MDILDIVKEVLLYERYEVKCIDNQDEFRSRLHAWTPLMVHVDYLLGIIMAARSAGKSRGAKLRNTSRSLCFQLIL